MHAKTEKIAESAGTSVGARNISARAIEDVMIEAVKQCVQEGINDPAEILRRKLAARQKLKRGQ